MTELVDPEGDPGEQPAGIGILEVPDPSHASNRSSATRHCHQRPSAHSLASAEEAGHWPSLRCGDRPPDRHCQAGLRLPALARFPRIPPPGVRSSDQRA